MERKPLDYQTWIHHRTLQYINFCYATFLLGTTFTIYFQTEYFYFKDVMKTKNPDFYYGLSWACLTMSGAICSVFVSYYGDRTHNIRGISITVSILNIIGNILYMLYYSPYIVLLGQFLAGTTASRSVSGLAEVSRVYCKSKVSLKLSIATIFSALGGLSGPCLTFAFKYINIEIGDWKLTIANMPGFCMCILSTAQLFLDYFILNNVSNEFDDLLPEDKIKTGIEKRQEVVRSVGDYLLVIKCLISNKYMLAVYIISFIATYSRATLLMLQPIKFHDYLAWTQTDLAIFNIIIIIGGALVAAITLSILTQYVEDFFIFVLAVSSIILPTLTQMVLAFYHTNKTMSYFMAYTIGASEKFSQCAFNIAVRVILIKFAPDNLRTVTDAMRSLIFETSFLLAGLTVKINNVYLVYTFPFITTLQIGSLLWVLIGHRHYQNIETINTGKEGHEIKELLGEE